MDADGASKAGGCDVRLTIATDRTGDCDVILEPTVHHAIEWIESAEHAMTPAEWAAWLADVAPEAYADPPAPQTPCHVEPGTEAKIQAMEERAAAGLDLHHPADPQIDSILFAARQVSRRRNGTDNIGGLQSLRWI